MKYGERSLAGLLVSGICWAGAEVDAAQQQITQQRPVEGAYASDAETDARVQFERLVAEHRDALTTRSLGRPAPAARRARLALAAGALELGLTVPALEQLDALFDDWPGDRAGLALVARMHDEALAEIALPGDAERAAARRAGELDGDLLDDACFADTARGLSDFPAAARELGLLRFADEARIAFDDDGTAERALALLDHRDGDVRALGADLLRAGAPAALERSARRLLVHALADAHPPARTACATAIGACAEPSVCAPLVRALGSESPEFATRAAEALAIADARSAIPALATLMLSPASAAPAAGGGAGGTGGYIYVGRQSAYVRDFDVEVATGQAIADPTVGVLTSGAVLEARVLSISPPRASLRKRVVRSLERLTDERLGERPDDWSRWWEARQAADATPASGTAPESN